MKILVLGTFPLEPARHGGQLRVRALLEAYRSLGHEAHYIAAYCPHFYLDTPTPELALTPGQTTLERIHREPCLEDLFLGEMVVHEPEARAKLLSQFETISPDFVQIEQPYLWASVREIFSSLRKRPKLISSTHNIEHRMKGAVYTRDLDAERAREAQLQVEGLEKDLAQKSDIVLAVTESEAQVLKGWGARHVQVIPNGAVLPSTSEPVLKSWQECLNPTGDRKWGLFVSSAHRPNLEGAENFLGPRLGYLPPNHRLVLAGGVCSLLSSSPLAGPLAGASRARLTALGTLSDEDLGALLRLTDLILLPISAGAGSNLKTAQALLTDRPILATSFAFRGYEEFQTLPGVVIADEPTEFKAAMLKVLGGRTQKHPRTESVHAKVLWSKFAPALLKPIVGSESGAGVAAH